MKKSAHDTEVAGGPEVIRFSALLEKHPAEAKASSAALLELPKSVGERLRSMTTVEGTINGHPFRAMLATDESGSVWLRVNKAMREGASAVIGDKVQLAVLGPESDPIAPADLQSALASSREAEALWQDLTLTGRRDWIRWIKAAKKPETRARRVSRTIEQLAEGKRRPCCVNVYEYMLCRVREE